MSRTAIWAAVGAVCGGLVLAGTAAAAHRAGESASAHGVAVSVGTPGRITRPPHPTGYELRWSRQPHAARALTSIGSLPDDEAVVGLGLRSSAGEVAARYGLRVVTVDDRIHAAKLAGDRDRLRALARRVGDDAALRYVERDHPLALEHRRDDPATTQVDPATDIPYEWPFARVGLDRALNLTNGSPDVLVGVVDSGISPVRDLDGKIAKSWYFPDEGTDTTDTEGHGTFVASIIAAGNDDHVGLAGFCGGCRLDVFKSVYTTDFSLALSIRRLVDDGVHIINLSLGRQGSPALVLTDAIGYAISKGVLIVASSGNDGTGEVASPATWLQPAGGGPSYGLAVGASDAAGARASFSNWGSHLSLLAPGAFNSGCTVGVWAALPPVSTDFDSGRACARTFTDPASGDRYGYASGTSFSAPEVAGVAALVWAARPELLNYQVAEIIKQSASRPAGSGWTADRGWGVLDAARALELATGRPSADEVVLGGAHAGVAPRAGRRFTIRARASWQDGMPLDGGTTHCTTTARGRRIASVDGTFSAGVAACSYRVPSWAAGRRMSISVSVTDSAGNAGSRNAAFSVRR